MFQIKYIKSDLYRYYGNYRMKTFIGALILNRSFSYSFWFRLAQSPNPFLSRIARIFHWFKSRKYGIYLPVEANVGYGLYIGHGMSIVINPTVKIGNNCNLSQFTTIGSNHNRGAIIGDNVYIGPNVCIVENVKIGNDCIVGAGAVVVNDVMPNTTVVGVPARVVGGNMHPEYVGNRWSDI